MKFNRFRAPALAAGALLMISGAGIAVAAKPAAALPAAATPVAQLEPTTPDADTLQQGDQTTPDLAGAGAAAKPAVAAGKASLAAAPKPKVAATAATETAAPETAGETAGETPEGTGSEAASDGPGGHADPAGQNVDHQFEGVE